LTEPSPNAAPAHRLDPVIAEYLESVERGGSSDPRPWIERYPDLADELEAFFAAEARFDRLVTPFRNGSPFAGPAGPPLRAVEDYELLSELGRGGMGVIYKARQRSLNRLVAVKMIRSAEWATPEERLRFRWEAETVATLDHPNIVPIYEVGEIASGDGTRLPFFSMKLVEGENLAQARGRFRGEWAGIARLLYLITRAVEHAHQRGVLHRDLKPANILLSVRTAGVPNEELRRGSGFVLGPAFVTPHVSDFGLARRAQHQRGGTLPGTVVGTPAYLAPELTRGHEFATSASDVYSLGAILYELLTGVPPFEGDTPLDTIRLVAAGAVKPPRKVNPAVPRDLETICLTCLEADPTRRYPSADKLAEDLDHFLAGRPVAARPTGRLTRLARWCRRQPVVAGLSAALVLALLTGLPLVAWNWRRAVEQERVAEARLGDVQAERDRADEASVLARTRLGEVQTEKGRTEEAFGLAYGALADVFRLLAEDRWDEAPGSEQAKRQVLENGLKYYRTFAARHRDDPKLRREVAQALFQRGLIATRIGPLREAVESYRAAIALLRPLAAEHPDEVALRELLARSLVNLGNALNALNRTNEAVTAHEEAGAVWAQIQKDRPERSDAAREQATAWLNRGVALQATEDWAGAIESFRRGQAVLAERGPAAKESRLAVQLWLSVAQVESRLGRREEAFRSAREADRIAGLMLKAAPRSEDARLATAYAARVVGSLHLKQGELDAAKTHLQRAQKPLDDLHQQRPRATEYAWNLALTYEDLAALAEKQKQPAEALKALGQAESLLKDLVARDGESHPHRGSLARVERGLGRLNRDLGNTDAARKAYEQAKVHLEYLLDHNSPRSTVRAELAGVCFQLGVACAKLQKFAAAAAADEEAAKHYRALLDRAPTDGGVRKDFSSALGNGAIAHRALKHLPEALRATEERVGLWPDSAAELYDAATDFARTFDLAARAGDVAAPVRDQSLKDAIGALRQALRTGLADREKLRTDARLAPLRDTPEFRALLKEVAGTPP
jgi:serine/threonine-protein kinase